MHSLIDWSLVASALVTTLTSVATALMPLAVQILSAIICWRLAKFVFGLYEEDAMERRMDAAVADLSDFSDAEWYLDEYGDGESVYDFHHDEDFD